MEAVPHFATTEIDASLRARTLAYFEAHRDSLHPADLELATKITFTTVEAVSEQTADADAEKVLSELAQMLERYLIRDGADDVR